MRALLIAPVLLLLASGPAAASDAAAHRLFAQGRHGEAAELFSDPRWKGVALYRSGQWWRAAEAFVRASDPDSLYNLGNCYARLGYPALALEAYNAALSRRPVFADAVHNANLMRRILAEDDQQGGQSAMRPQAEAIDTVEAKPESEGAGTPPPDPTGEDAAPEERHGAGEQPQAGGNETPPGDEAGADAGAGGTDGTPRDRQPAGGGAVDGRENPEAPSADASGGSAGTDETALALSAGARARLEAEQEAAQWLNRISDDPAKYLRSRIALEHRRRKAAGAVPAESGDTW